MRIKICFAVILTAAAPLCSQVNPVPAGPAADAVMVADSRMLTPPPVSGEPYAVEGTAETRSNYLRGGINFASAYTDNVLGGATGHPISDMSYSIWPTLALDKSNSRLHSVLTYSPGFTFYQRVSSRNEADENVGADLQYRLSPHLTVSLRDSFQKMSNVFNQSDPVSGNRIFGSAPAPIAAVIVPVADRLTNTGNAVITYQYGLNGMVGASGTFSNLHYPSSAEVPGLFDSSSRTGSAFYNHRLSRKHYIGATYQYQKTLVETESRIQSHTLFLFYTIYLKPTLSLSLSGGPQNSEVIQSTLPAVRTWSPAMTASVGWQGHHTSLAASYSRMVSGGGGLLGAFHSNNGNLTASWQWARTWNIGLTGAHSTYKNLDPLAFLSNPGGHSISGAVSIRHQLGEHLSIEAGYSRLHQSFRNLAVTSLTPDTNRGFVSIAYQFVRPLGR
jgi:hypothetical protein